MENGFCFECYNTVYNNCFIHRSRYADGSLQLSLFGTYYLTGDTTHFADITLNQNRIKLAKNEIIVDCKFKPSFVPQLVELGILKEQVSTYIANNMFYPIYTVDLEKINEKGYVVRNLVAA